MGPEKEALLEEIRNLPDLTVRPSSPSLDPSRGPYLFRVSRAEMDVHVNPDASVRIEYEIVFHNAPRARYLDVVDMGLPSANFDMREIRAWLDDHEIQRIGASPYVNPGVAVTLGDHSIPRGGSGVFRFEARVTDAVYQGRHRSRRRHSSDYPHVVRP